MRLLVGRGSVLASVPPPSARRFPRAPNPVEIEGSPERAADRGRFGFTVSDGPSLADPAVVHGLVAQFVAENLALRSQYLWGEIDRDAAIDPAVGRADAQQAILHGKTTAFETSDWNAPDRLGARLVAHAVGGDRADAVSRLLLALAKDMSDAADAGARMKTDDDVLQAVVEDALLVATAHLLGMPPSLLAGENEPEE